MKTQKLKVLFIEDSQDDFSIMLRELHKGKYEIEYKLIDNAEKLEVALEEGWDVIISDYSLPSFTGFDALNMCNKKGIDTPFIMVSATVGEETAVEMMRSGAKDYIMKNHLIKLLPAIEREIEGAKVRKEHKQAEEAIIESEKRFRDMSDLLPQIVFEADLNGNITYVNQIAFKLTGYSQEDFDKGFNTMNFLIPEDRERAMRKIGDTLNGEKESSLSEYIALRKDGSTYPILVFSNANIRNNKLAGFKGIIIDITERKQIEIDLQDSEAKFSMAFKTAPYAITITDAKNGSFIDVNDAFYAITGYTCEEASNNSSIGLSLWVDEEDRYRVVKELHNGEEIVGQEFRFKKKNGEIITGLFSAQLITLKGITYILSSINDITERKQAEKALQASKDYLDKIINTVASPIFVKDDKHKFCLVNNALYSLLNLKVEDLIGKTGYEYFPEDQMKVFIAKDQEVLNTGIENVNEEFLTDGSGKVRTIVARKTLYTDKAGNKFLVGVINDITELKEIENKVREKDIQFRKLSANLPDLIYQFTRRLDGTYYVPIASEGIKNIFGCTPEDVIDDFAPIGKVIFSEDAERVIADIENSAKHLTYFTSEFRVQIPGREIQWILSRSTPEKLADGSITWYGFNANITELKQTETELIKAKEKAEESDRLKTAFLCNMSHEIRTPMNAIVGFSSFLKDPDLSQENKDKYCEIIDTNTLQLLHILEDIIEISKIETCKIKFTNEEIDVKEFMKNLYKEYRLINKNQLLEIRYIIRDNIPSSDVISIDINRLRQVLNNLISNALKFTKKGYVEFGYDLVRSSEFGVQSKEFVVQSSENKQLRTNNSQLITFYVKDTGIGIADKHKELVFDRFRQAEEHTTKTYGGNGLGLAISKKIVEAMGGEIWVESQEGKGSTFIFTIPYIPVKKTPNPNPIPNSIPDLSKIKILVADDVELSFSLFQIMLGNTKVKLLWAKNGKECIEMFKKNKDIDMVLMDIQMPIINGIEATKIMKKLRKDVPVIAQTAYAMTADREHCIEAGCDDVLTKPIKEEELMGMIKKYIS